MDSYTLEETIQRLETDHIIARIWDRDPTVWGSPDGREITDRLGWLTVVDTMTPRLTEIQAFAREIRDDGFTHIVLLGMGGSSLAPHVLAKTLAPQDGYPRFHMLDSTVPAAVLQCEHAIDLAHTLFIVASKSGSTIEMLSMFKYFWQRVSATTASPGRAFVAITDPGSGLERIAREHAFRAIFLNPTDIGGRYSALSLFGLVPAALAGVDVARLLQSAERMAARCSPAVPARENPGALLGVFLGAMARHGRDKLALAISHRFADLGLWIEQLIAESTGKHGTGILPVVLPQASRLADQARRLADHALIAIAPAGEAASAPQHPAALVRELPDPYELGGEFYCWEMATAVAGHILGVNPFDQPNVAEAKRNTANMLALYERRGALEPADAITLDARTDTSAPAETLRRFFAEIQPGHYCAILAYLPPSDQWDALFAELQEHLALRLGVAFTFGYGPRYLHSTGQLHKGGPATGHFLILTADDAEDVPVPGERYTFGVLKNAQALGDRQALETVGRPVLHFHLAGEARQTAHALRQIVQAAQG
ncbi:MAG: glucose-6-phosphate isomerase [Anaerolineae bacterium]|nr:glucose-6-phosphate isomerase [Anaerolineae bacterium]